MKKQLIAGVALLVLAGLFIVFVYPKPFSSQQERKILYWTDPMIPGDRSDHPGKSPMGMERVPVYADQATAEADTTSSYYTCPMHPSVRKDKPGACPVCGMALVKKSAKQDITGVDAAALMGISLSPTQRVMGNVSTAAVESKALRKEISAVGVVDFAEPNYQQISMRFPGRLEKLYLTFTGQPVRKGDPVADVYSPEAISAQQEYILARDSYEQTRNAPEKIASEAADLLSQAKEKLLRWGFTEQQVNSLKSNQIHRLVTVHSPISGVVIRKNVDPQHYAAMGEEIYAVADLSRVWVYLDVYEKDIRFVKTGQIVHITTEAYPAETFTGRVTFLDPVLNAETRTVRVRTEFANASGKLKPNMFVKARISVPLNKSLVVPASAILATGRRNIVWVEKQENVFEPRDVLIGATTESYAQVLDGLRGGEQVAATGGFLIDSESELEKPGEVEELGVDKDGGARASTESFARPSEYFKSHESHADNNEVGVLVKGRYAPEVIHVKVGQPVTLHFYRDEDADCTNEVVFESLGIRRRLPARETTTITFTPEDTGEIGFSCGMGMVRGKLIVEKN